MVFQGFNLFGPIWTCSPTARPRPSRSKKMSCTVVEQGAMEPEERGTQKNGPCRGWSPVRRFHSSVAIARALCLNP